jgi:purine-binding chemotaxis protein CheW
VFRASGFCFGMPIGRIAEVLPRHPVTPLPGSEPFIGGIINVRGHIVTLMDLGRRLGLSPVLEREDYQVVVLEHRGARAALAVDEVSGLRVRTIAEREESAAVLRGLRLEQPFFTDVGEIDGQLCVGLDPDEILSPILT